ncbi:hypothetical protein MRX96_025141 [Rhipicephalus microplus]
MPITITRLPDFAASSGLNMPSKRTRTHGRATSWPCMHGRCAQAAPQPFVDSRGVIHQALAMCIRGRKRTDPRFSPRETPFCCWRRVLVWLNQPLAERVQPQ